MGSVSGCRAERELEVGFWRTLQGSMSLWVLFRNPGPRESGQMASEDPVSWRGPRARWGTQGLELG